MLRRELGAAAVRKLLGHHVAVEDIEDVLVRLQAHGAELVGEASSKRTATGLLRTRLRGHHRRRWASSSAEAAKQVTTPTTISAETRAGSEVLR